MICSSVESLLADMLLRCSSNSSLQHRPNAETTGLEPAIQFHCCHTCHQTKCVEYQNDVMSIVVITSFTCAFPPALELVSPLQNV